MEMAATKDLDLIYEMILADKEFFKIVTNFHSSKWNNLDLEEKKQLFFDMELRVSAIFGDTPTNISFSGDDDNLGSYNNEFMFINPNSLEGSFSQYDCLNTYLHERRHKLQEHSHNGNISQEIRHTVSDETIELWKKNLSGSIVLGIFNYFSAGSGYYFDQPIEADAFSTADYLTIRIGKEVERYHGKDPKFAEYLMAELKSGVHQDKENSEKRLKHILETWDKNEKKLNAYKELKEKQMEYLDELEKISDTQLYSFFNEYIWIHLKTEERSRILQELDKRDALKENRERLNIGFNEKAVTIDGREILDVLSLYALNDYYSDAFEKGIINNILKESKKEGKLSDLEINLYENGEGKRINFYENSKHPFLFMIQPYGLLDSKYLSEKLNFFKPYAINGINNEKLQYEVDWEETLKEYDLNRIARFVESFYEKDFEEVYKIMLAKMKDNIDKDMNKIR